MFKKGHFIYASSKRHYSSAATVGNLKKFKVTFSLTAENNNGNNFLHDVTLVLKYNGSDYKHKVAVLFLNYSVSFN